MRLLEALRLGSSTASPCIAFVGAGGKTIALFTLARELVETPGVGDKNTVLVTTSTHLGVTQAAQADHHRIVATEEDLDQLAAEMPSGVLLVTGEPNDEGRLGSPSTDILDGLRMLAASRNLPLLIEADGARMLPLKAPALHEPAIPPFVDVVVVVAGMNGLGKPLSPKYVHRPEVFASMSGLSAGDPISARSLLAVLAHPMGGLKNIPAAARRLVLLNQADTLELRSIAGAMAIDLLESYHAILVASLISPILTNGSLTRGEAVAGNSYHQTVLPIHTVHERIAGIILAAGGSQRFGIPKPLLLWRGEPFIRHVIRSSLAGGLSPVIVVGGDHTPELRQVCSDLSVELVHNPDWSDGQSTSVHAGLRHLPEEVGAAVFLLADQPQVPAGLVRLLAESYSAGLPPIVAPLVDGRRANPVLFDRTTFTDLAALQGDVGGRALFSKYPITWIPWHDSSVLLDVDNHDDYARLLELDAG